MGENIKNLYVHFPFCRRKCTYCALYSKCARPVSERDEYSRSVSLSIQSNPLLSRPLSTVYFGGGSPALCNLRPIFDALTPFICDETEFTVELHPDDVNEQLLSLLKGGGVNRISMGVQSLDDDTLRHMNRGYTFADAQKAFELVKKFFDNAGIDLIIGYPDVSRKKEEPPDPLSSMGLRHCSVYSLIVEEKTPLSKLLSNGRIELPSDESTLDAVARMASYLESIGLMRYEISNYAVPGFECRHNMATWNGEDYAGIGYGAHGRIGLTRMKNYLPARCSSSDAPAYECEKVSETFDKNERLLFRLRTSSGLNPNGDIHRKNVLEKFSSEGLLHKTPDGAYKLTARGYEVCDSIIAELL